MAQTPQAGTGGVETPAANDSQGSIFNPVTLALLAVVAIWVFFSMRRRRALEERFQVQQREQRMAEAQRSAMDVANIMRPVSPSAARAAATEGLASAAAVPVPPAHVEPEPVPDDEEEMLAAAAIREQVDGQAELERTAAERTRQAAQEAETAGRSDARRMAAAAAAADEVAADTVEALRVRETVELDVAIPQGAVAGDGTANCPEAYPIKGNASSHIYHEPGQSSYAVTIPEFCFASAAEAEAAGYRPSRARGQRSQK
ncbi:MAG: hypothetical protein U0031_09690 [Thermomicrobiales bacterium]